MSTIGQKLTQLEQDREDFVNNLTAKGIKDLTGDETFTELVPKILEIPTGGGSDYQEVEWIQSDGNQFIDTGVYPSSSSDKAGYEISFDPLSTSARGYEQYFAGTRDTGNGYISKIFCVGSNIVLSPSIYGGSDTTIGALGGGRLDVEITTTNGIVVNNTQLATYSGLPWGMTNNGMSFYVFSSHSEPNLKSSMKLYKLKMYTNGDKVRDFMPCYRKSDGEIGLYDKVSHTFFSNTGTGTFTKGPDVN